MTAIFDTHAHYDDKAFDGDREALLAALPQNGIARVVNIGASLASCERTVTLMEKYDYIYGAIGIHPSETAELEEQSSESGDAREQRSPEATESTDAREQRSLEVLESGDAREQRSPEATESGDARKKQLPEASDALERLKAMCRHEKCVAVGEIGLDYYWDEPDREIQKKWFVRQLQLARECALPVVIHSRDAARDTVDIMEAEKAGEIGGVIHCYSYTKETARTFLDMGFFFGIGGVLTFQNARKLKEAVEYIPMDRIVLETDCPYLAPVPFRGKRNSSLNLPFVVSALAQIKGISEEEVRRAAWENGLRLYGMEGQRRG